MVIVVSQFAHPFSGNHLIDKNVLGARIKYSKIDTVSVCDNVSIANRQHIIELYVCSLKRNILQRTKQYSRNRRKTMYHSLILNLRLS